MEQAAEYAGISRTTAYRYFPNQRALLMAAHPETAATTLLPVDAPGDPGERLAIVIQQFTELILATEPQQRTMLRLSLEMPPAGRTSLPLRQGRAIAWIEEALEPVRETIPEDAFHRLVLAIRTTAGIEALAWLTDVAQLPREDAAALMRWSAGALLFAAVNGTPPSSPSSSSSSDASVL